MLPPHRAMNCASSKKVCARASSSGSPVIPQQWPCCARSVRGWIGILGLVLTFFCAGTPSTKGTLDLIKSLNVSPEKVASVRYRGDGWPGRFRVISAEGGGEKSLAYMESWSRLSHDRAFRCQLCPDGLGRVADITCGDAWERFGDGQDMGRSVAVVRTRKGQEILHRAMAAKYVELEPVGATASRRVSPAKSIGIASSSEGCSPCGCSWSRFRSSSAFPCFEAGFGCHF